MAALQTVVCLLAVLAVSYGQSGSGSGSGTSCADITCWGGGTCIDDGSDPYCDCPIGKALYDDPYYCEDCEIGYWGEDCKVKCSDTCGGEGRIQSCDAVNGTCVCNKCWELSDEETCSVGTGESQGYACYLDFIESEDKNLDDYAGEIPRPHENRLADLADDLFDDPGSVIQDDTISLTIIDRDDVGARPLSRFQVELSGGPGDPNYDSAIETIQDRVKTGEYRGTLIIDESDGDSGKVTLNV